MEKNIYICVKNKLFKNPHESNTWKRLPTDLNYGQYWVTNLSSGVTPIRNAELLRWVSLNNTPTNPNLSFQAPRN
jgi:hypothetical protein